MQWGRQSERCTCEEAASRRARTVREEFAPFDRLRAWFGIGHTLRAYEPKPGANVELSVELMARTSTTAAPSQCWSPFVKSP